MAVTVKRNTGWMGRGSKLQIIVNGRKVAKVAEKQDVKVNIPKKQTYLRVSQMGFRSNVIEVKNGDTVKVKATKWYILSFPIVIVLMFLIINFVNEEYMAEAMIGLMILLIVSMAFINGFYIEVEEKDKK